MIHFHFILKRMCINVTSVPNQFKVKNFKVLLDKSFNVKKKKKSVNKLVNKSDGSDYNKY